MKCTCIMCRRGVRITIEQVFRSERRWLGEYSIYFHGRLGWCDLGFYRSVLTEMVQRGLLVRIAGDHNGFPVYLPWRLAAVAMADAEIEHRESTLEDPMKSR